MPEPGGTSPETGGNTPTDTGSDAMSSITGSSGRESSGRGGRGRGRNRGGRGSGSRGRAAATMTPRSNFKGRQEGLEDFVFDLTNPTAAAASYSVTLERIAEHIGSEWTGAGLIKQELMTLELQEYEKPTAPDPNASEIDKQISQVEVSEYVKDMRKLKAHRQRAVALVWGQCSDSIRSKIEGQTGYKEAMKGGDLIRLCKMIQAVMYQFKAHKKMSLSILEGKLRIYRYRQQPDQSTADYHKMFKRYVDAAEYNGGSFGYDKGLVEAILAPTRMEDASSAEIQTAIDKSREEPGNGLPLRQ
jgi:hypothetical protein